MSALLTASGFRLSIRAGAKGSSGVSAPDPPFILEVLRAMLEANDLPPCFIQIDKEGRWLHKDLEMLRRDIVRFFYEHMEMDSRGRYVIHLADQKCYVDVEDTAFVVRRVMLENDKEGEGRFLILLSDDTQEALNLETLYVGEQNVLYCRVKDGRFPARFWRAAYYQLAEHLEEEDGKYFIPLRGRKHVIPQLHCRSAPDGS